MFGERMMLGAGISQCFTKGLLLLQKVGRCCRRSPLGRAGQSHRSEPGRSTVRDAAAKDGTGSCWVQVHLVFLASSRTGEDKSSPAQCLPQCSNTTPKGRKARNRLLDRYVSPGWTGQKYENASPEHPGRTKLLLKKATKIIDFLPTCPIDQLQ